MKLITAAAIFLPWMVSAVGTGKLTPAPDVVLSRLLESIELKDGTNAVAKTHAWGNTCVVRYDGSGRFVSVTNGTEVPIPCGGSIHVKIHGASSAKEISVLPGVVLGNGNPDETERRPDARMVTIRVYEPRSLDIRFLPQINKTYDAMAQKYIDLPFPFKTIWEGPLDMLLDDSKRIHRSLAAKARERAEKVLVQARAYCASDRVRRSGGVPRTVRARLPEFAAATNTLIQLSEDGAVVGVKALCADGVACTYVYSEEGRPQWYCENTILENGKWRWNALVRYDEAGRMRESMQRSVKPQYMPFTEKGAVVRWSENDVRKLLDAAVKPVFLMWREGSVRVGAY